MKRIIAILLLAMLTALTVAVGLAQNGPQIVRPPIDIIEKDRTRLDIEKIVPYQSNLDLGLLWDCQHVYAPNFRISCRGNLMVLSVATGTAPVPLFSFISEEEGYLDAKKIGNYLYIIASGAGPQSLTEEYLNVYDVQNPTNPVKVNTVSISWPHLLRDNENAMAEVNGYLLIASGAGVHVFDLSDPTNPTEIRFLEHLNTHSVSANGNLVAVASRGQWPNLGGVHLYDFSNPTNPEFLGELDGSFAEVEFIGARLFAISRGGCPPGDPCFDSSAIEIDVTDVRRPQKGWVPKGQGSTAYLEGNGRFLFLTGSTLKVYDMKNKKDEKVFVFDPSTNDEYLGINDIRIHGNTAYITSMTSQATVKRYVHTLDIKELVDNNLPLVTKGETK